jgi:hypothetical protein
MRTKRRGLPPKKLVGKTFGDLNVLRDLPTRKAGNGEYRRMVECRCACGRTKAIRADHLTDKATPVRSCGLCRHPVSFDPRTAGRIASILYDLDGSDRKAWRAEAIRLLTGSET